MIWIFYISFAVMTSTTQSLKARWKLGPDLASSAEFAHIDSNSKTAKNMGIDMDYFGGSSERMQRTSDEFSAGRSEIEPPRINPVDRSNPMIVYVVDPNVLEERQENLMKVRSVKSSSLESDGVTYEDLLKFLMQVGARIKEQKGTNPLSEHPNLIDLIRNTRRRTDDDSYETDKSEPIPVKSDIDSNERVKIKKELKAPRRPPIRKKELSIEKFDHKESGRNKFVSREEPPPPRWKKQRERISMEEPPRPQKKKRGSNIARLQRYSYEPLALKDGFRTAKPYIGKVGIYEDK